MDNDQVTQQLEDGESTSILSSGVCINSNIFSSNYVLLALTRSLFHGAFSKPVFHIVGVVPLVELSLVIGPRGVFTMLLLVECLLLYELHLFLFCDWCLLS